MSLVSRSSQYYGSGRGRPTPGSSYAPYQGGDRFLLSEDEIFADEIRAPDAPEPYEAAPKEEDYKGAVDEFLTSSLKVDEFYGQEKSKDAIAMELHEERHAVKSLKIGKKRFASLALIHKGLRSSIVCGTFVKREKEEDPDGFNQFCHFIRAACTLTMGNRNPFGRSPVPNAFAELKERRFSVVFYGVRHRNDKAPIARLYFYSDELDVRRIIAEMKDGFEEVLPLTFVDPTHCKDSCDDTCTSQQSDQAWLCRLRNEYERFAKTLRPPPEEHQMAMFPYFLWQDSTKPKEGKDEDDDDGEMTDAHYGTEWCILRTKVEAGTADPAIDVGDGSEGTYYGYKANSSYATIEKGVIDRSRTKKGADSRFFKVYSISLCEDSCDTVYYRDLDIYATASFPFISSYCYLQLLCWLNDLPKTSNKTLDWDNIKSWNPCVYSLDDKFELDVSLDFGIRNKALAGLMYLWQARRSLTLLRLMLDGLLGEEKVKKEEKACYGSLMCKLEVLYTQVDEARKRAFEKAKKEGAREDMCQLSEIQGLITIVTQQLVEFVTLLHGTVAKGMLPPKICNVLNTAVCTLASKVLPWYKETVVRLDADFAACRMTYQRTKLCISRVMLPSPVLLRRQLLLQLYRAMPELFKDRDEGEPKTSDLRERLLKKPNAPEAALIKQYLELETMMDLQRRMAEYDLSLAEMCDAESQLCEVLKWATSKKIVTEGDASYISHWIFSTFEQFRKTAAMEDHRLVTRALKRRKRLDKDMRDLIQKAVKSVQSALEILNEVFMTIGINPVVDTLLTRKADDAVRVQGLAALISARCSDDALLLASLSKAARVGSTGSTGTFDALAAVANAFKNAPHGPLVNSEFVSLAVPYSHQFLKGALDGKDYLPATIVGTGLSNFIAFNST